MKNIFFIILFLSVLPSVDAQSNTAITSGVIGKCAVWNYPYTLYNNGGASQIINDGVTVTVDQNRNIGAVNFASTGGMNFAGGNGITMSGTGGEIRCRWDINGLQSFRIVNNQNQMPNNEINVSGVIFTAPYSGNYIWKLGSGWSANVYGAFKNAGISLFRNLNFSYNIFYSNQPGYCGIPTYVNTPQMGPLWVNTLNFNNTNSGDFFIYSASTGYSPTSTCRDTTLDGVLSNGTFLYDN